MRAGGAVAAVGAWGPAIDDQAEVERQLALPWLSEIDEGLAARVAECGRVVGGVRWRCRARGCPSCGRVRATRQGRALALAIRRAAKLGPVWHVVLTQPVVDWETLERALGRLYRSLGRWVRSGVARRSRAAGVSSWRGVHVVRSESGGWHVHAHVLLAGSSRAQAYELAGAWVAVSPGAEGASQEIVEVSDPRHQERLGWYLARRESQASQADEAELVAATRGRQLVRGSGCWADWQRSPQTELWAQKNGGRPGGVVDRRATESRDGCELPSSTGAQDPSMRGRRIVEGLLADQAADAKPDDGGMVGTGYGDHCTLELADSGTLASELVGERVQAQGSQEGVAGEDERLAGQGYELSPVQIEVHPLFVSRGAREVVGDDPRGGALDGIGGPGVAGGDVGRGVPGVAHPGGLIDAEPADFGGEARTEAVGAVETGVFAGEHDQAPHDRGDGLGAEATSSCSAREDGAAAGPSSGLVELGEGGDRAKPQVGAVARSAGQADDLVAAAVGLGPPEPQDPAVGVLEGVGPVERDELAAAQGGGEADQDQGSVPEAASGVERGEAAAAQADERQGERGRFAGPSASGSDGASPAGSEGEADQVVMRGGGLAVGAGDPAERGDPAGDGGRSSAEGFEVLDVEGDGVAVEGWFGVQALGVAPAGPAAQIGAVGAEGVGGVGVRDQVGHAAIERASWVLVLVATCWLALFVLGHGGRSYARRGAEQGSRSG